MKNLEINVIINFARGSCKIGKVVVMTIEELKILAKQGEGYTLEFKENLGKNLQLK